jgi:hypothetical protein
MLNKEQLISLTGLISEFQNAAEEYSERTPGVEEKILASFKDDEMDYAVDIAQKMVLGISSTFGSASEELLLLNVEASEFKYELVARVIDQDTLKGFLPEGLKTADSVAQLEAVNAPKLAALCKATL